MTTNGQNGSSGSGERARRPGREIATPLPKRFYKDVSVEPTAAGQFTILLDGRRAKTPKKNDLALPARAVADALGEEWSAQGERIDPAHMPLTRLANTAIDAVTGREASVRADIVKYAGSDLLCYRAERPTNLVNRQAAHWDPILTWARQRYGAGFVIATGLMHVAQPASVAARVGAVVEPLDAFRLTPMHVMTTLSGSAVLALAVYDRSLTAGAAWATAHVDEDWQIESWGEDAEASVRRQARWIEMAAAARLLDLLAD